LIHVPKQGSPSVQKRRENTNGKWRTILSEVIGDGALSVADIRKALKNEHSVKTIRNVVSRFKLEGILVMADDRVPILYRFAK
jgi:hypothetical protein